MQPNDRKNEMEKMRLDGYTLQEIGDKYGITRERVRQLVGDRVDGFETRRKRASRFVKDATSVPFDDVSKLAKKLRASAKELFKNRTGRRCVVDSDGMGYVSAGHETEEIVSKKLNSLGIKNQLMPNHHAFDVLVEENIRVDVKGAYKKATTSDLQVSPMYRFCVRKRTKGDYCDFFIFYATETKDFFVIPNDVVGYVDAVYIGYPSVYNSTSKWMQYKNRFDLLKG